MGTLLLYAVVAIAIGVVVVAALIVFLPPGRMVAPVVAADVIPDGLPTSGQLLAEDIARIRLPVGLRGYRMTEVDAILDRLAVEIELRDQRLEKLSRPVPPAEPARPDPDPGDAAEPGPSDA